jgi:polyhydroxyalkanoate synthesis regulator phasin
MKNNKKVATIVITAVAITGSASALASASSTKSKSAVTKTSATVKQIHMNNGVNDAMGGMRGFGGPLTGVLADLVTKGTISAAESKAVSDAYAALEAAEHAATAPTTPKTPPVAGEISPELAQALKDLVSKGTLTQAKADAITAAVKTAIANRPAKPNGPMGGGFQNANKEAVITATLGIDATTLRTRLAAGESLATIAGAKKDALIAALVADETKQIDAAVAAGKLTAAQANTLKAGLTAHVTEEVNEAGHMGGFGGPGRGHGGRGGHGDMDGHGRMGMPNGTTNGIPQTSTSGTNN